MNTGVLSLYIHIPFCSRKCAYCDFFSKPPENDELQLVLNKIVDELIFSIDKLNSPYIKSVFIGGGTPSLVVPSVMNQFIIKIKNCLPNLPEEWTCEVNPESLKSEHLSVFKSNGINRISIGIQSFDPKTLNILGRQAGPEDIERSLDLLKNNWSENWNGDIICEIPEQKQSQALEDIKKLTTYNPSHISLYALSLEPKTPLGERYKNQANIDETIWTEAADLIEKKGWERYEVSNFARKGFECEHNKVYWRMEPFLGIGPSASSTLYFKRKPYRRTNPGSIHRYLQLEWESTWLTGGESIEIISPNDYLLEYLMMGFRMIEGINKKTFFALFGRTIEDYIPLWMETNLHKGYLFSNDVAVGMTPLGCYFSNPLLVEAALELDLK